MTSPKSEYQQRLTARQSALTATESISRRYWLWRRVSFIIIPILIVLSIEDYVTPLLIAVPVLAYLILMIRHQKVMRAIDHYRRAVTYYENCLARLDDEWIGRGVTGENLAVAGHPYAVDLDIFGQGSLFELLCRARTRAGEGRLASWLLAPASPATIRIRQQAIAELRERLDLREDLALLGDDVRSAIDDRELVKWGEAAPTRVSPLVPLMAAILGLTTLTAVILWIAQGYRTFALGAIFIEAIFIFIYRHRVGLVIAAVDRPGRDLGLLAGILARIEAEPLSAGPLAEIRRRLEVDGEPPSRQIARLSRLIEILDSTRNQFFAPFAFVLLVPTQIALAIERWRIRSGSSIAPWIEAVAELEALSSLAGFAFENPDHVFAEMVEESSLGAVYEARALGHPLLPSARCVRNDIALGGARQVLIVSGSNMSGKSTMMRTIGINAVLAFAGAPVRARQLRLSPLSIGASIQIQDSLQGGASRFYAEITRLKQIVELTRGERPLLFLLDEILSGTNSHDRRIGAEAIIRGLVERGAIGLTTTHDLALTRMVEPLGDRAANVPFEDHLEDGKMVFDYRMQPGIVTHSNALELMRAVGLEV
ncbi:MAG: MutS-related protein [Acidobacteriota bacterium]